MGFVWWETKLLTAELISAGVHLYSGCKTSSDIPSAARRSGVKHIALCLGQSALWQA